MQDQRTRTSHAQRDQLIAVLEGMTAYLQESFGSLTPEQARAPGPGGAFSPVEHVWHLTDLEREGFNRRISRLLMEKNPLLPDFDGDAIARQRNYRSRSLPDGLAAFAKARRANLAALRAVPADAWSRSGTLEGVGRVALDDMAGLMSRHDESHRAEIEAWKRHTALGGEP